MTPKKIATIATTRRHTKAIARRLDRPAWTHRSVWARENPSSGGPIAGCSPPDCAPRLGRLPNHAVAGEKVEMKKVSAGLLLYRLRGDTLEVFLVHPGGPYWVRRDLGAWTIPKGECSPGEDLLAAARREFEEETGTAPAGDFVALGAVTQPGGKRVHAWALRGDVDTAALRSNRFTIEWPPRSGRQREFPEIDRAAWFPLREARKRILKGQAPLLDELERMQAKSVRP